MNEKEAIERIRDHNMIHSKKEPYTPLFNTAMCMAIGALEKQMYDKWIPCSERLPDETGYYLCTVEWYGTSTKKLLISNGHEIEKRIMLVHFLDSNKSFKECDEFCTYKVVAWKLQEPYEE